MDNENEIDWDMVGFVVSLIGMILCVAFSKAYAVLP